MTGELIHTAAMTQEDEEIISLDEDLFNLRKHKH